MARTAKKTDEAMENTDKQENMEISPSLEAGNTSVADASASDGGEPAGNDGSSPGDAGNGPTTATCAENPDGENPDLAPAKVETCETAAAHGPELESISSLSAKHRLPTWQTAALLRLMDWEDDIMVTDADFRMAIDRLRNRRIGCGRSGNTRVGA